MVRVAVRGDAAVASRSFGPPGGRSAGCSAGQKQAWILGRRGRTGANQLVPAGRNDPKAYRLRRGALAAGAARPVVGAESFFKSKRAEPSPLECDVGRSFFGSLFAASQHRGLRRARPPAAVCWLSQALARSCVNTLAKQLLAGSGPERARDSAARCEAQPWALLNAPSAAAPAPAQLTRRAGALLCQPAVSSARGRRWRGPNAAAVPPGSRRDSRPARGAKLGRVHADVGAAAGRAARRRRETCAVHQPEAP